MATVIDGETGKATWHNKVVNKMKKIGSTSSPIPTYQIPGYSVGLPLDRCPMSKNNPSLSLLVEHCCQVVENKGLDSVGIYRVPGNSANVAALEEELNSKSPDTIDFEEQRWNDANNMGSLLKKFLRKLPEGLVTSELYGMFIEANRKDGEDRMLSLKDLIQHLPCVYGETLRYLISHLKRVSEHSDTNKMEIRNLAIVFGPTIVRTGEDNMMTMVNDMSDRFRIVESFITNYDWFFDNEPLTNGSISPSSPPVEDFTGNLMSTNMLNSIERAAVSYDSNESNWKFKGPSIKLPNFRNFMKHGSDSSKKSDFSSNHGGSADPLDNGNISPVTLSPYAGRPAGGSQPNSPTTGRRKFIKRHHSTSNISTPPVHDDFDRSKSEGEDDEVLLSRPSHSTKAYDKGRPPPPSYRELRDKGSFRGLPSHFTSTSPPPPVAPREPPTHAESGDTPDFNSLSEDTKRRLLRVTLQKKVNEKKKQQIAAGNSGEFVPTVDFHKGVVNMSFVQGDHSSDVSNPSIIESNTEDQSVVCEAQLKPSEIKKRFEHLSDNNTIPIVPSDEKQTVISEAAPQLRRRGGPTASSSSRNFKIYLNADVNFSQGRSNHIDDWVHDMEHGGTQGPERGRRLTKADGKEQRSASVSRATFVQAEGDVHKKRRSASCQDINIQDSENVERTRPLSKSSDSSDTSDEEADVYDDFSVSFDEKLRGLMQKNKQENKGKTDEQPVRKLSQVNRPSSYIRSKTSVEKMRAMDPTSKIQTGAVSSMKSLFESGAAHLPAKSRSSSISSNSSGSILSIETQRKKSASGNTIPEAEVKRRVWEVEPTGETPKKWKEPVWLAKEREKNNLKSGSETSIPATSDDNNNIRKGHDKSDYVTKQYSRSVSLPSNEPGHPMKRTIIEDVPQTTETTVAVSKPNVKPTSSGESKFGYTKRDSSPVKTVTTVKNITSPKTTLPQKSPPVSKPMNSAEPKTDTSHSSVRNAKSLPAETDKTASKQKAVRTRRRIVSDTHHRGYADSRHPSGRTFTAPILGSVVTTTAFELEGFAIKPQNTNRNSKSRRKSEKGSIGPQAPQPKRSLNMPKNSSHMPPGNRKQLETGILAIPVLDDTKRLSTDRSILEQNALHIKELLDEMNTEHSLKMERQKSDTISMNAQKSARKKALRRRHSLGQERGENGIVVTSCLSPSNGINSEHARRENNASLSTTNSDLQRNMSSVKWVGVSS